MGRRKRRRKVVLKPKRKLPTVFQCPSCGYNSVSVSIRKKDKLVLVKCSVCGLHLTFDYNPYLVEVDYYSKFLDSFERGEIVAPSQIEGVVGEEGESERIYSEETET